MASSSIPIQMDENFKKQADHPESNVKELEQRIADIESGKSIPKEHDLIEV